MRISDWSSDVCSSDLLEQRQQFLVAVEDVEVAEHDDVALGLIDDAAKLLELLLPDRPAQREMGEEHGQAGRHPDRSEERRVGIECVSTCRSRRARYH